MRLHEAALARPVSTFVGALALVAIGAVSLTKLPVALLPALEKPRLVVTATAASRSREELRRGVTEPLERRLSSIPGVSSLSSETEDGRVRIVLGTDWQTDPDRLRIDAARRVDGSLEPRPDELTVEVAGGDPSPLVEVAVLGGASGAARTAYARKVLLPELARVQGAGRVELLGETPLHAVVTPRAADLVARGLTALDVEERLAAVGASTGAGQVREGAAIRPALVKESVASLEELRAVRLPLRGGGAVPLGDVADLSLQEVPDGTSFRWDGADGVVARLHRAPGANAVALARGARAAVDALARRAQGGLALRIVSDRSREVASALGELGLSAVAGLLLGTLVLRFMLGRWTPTLALSVVIPASLLASFAAFHLFGIPLDVVSLGGLALASGMLVDNSIVVLEAIETARQRGAADAPREGTGQIALAVVTSSLTTALVFVPLLYVRGLARAFFGEQAFAVVASLGASLLLSLTLTPVLAGRSRPSASGRSPGLAAFGRALERALARPGLALVAAGAITVATLAALAALPRELLPRGTSRVVAVRYALPPDLSIPEASRRGLTVEQAIADAAGSGVVTRAWRGLAREEGEAPEPWRGLVEVELADAGAARRAAGRIGAVRIPGATLDVGERASAFAEAVRAGGPPVLVASVPDDGRLEALATRVAEAARRELGAEVTAEEGERPRAALLLSWDETRLARLGLSRETLEREVRAALGERKSGRLDRIGVEPDIRLAPTVPSDPRLGPVRVTASEEAGSTVAPLGALATLSPGVRPARLLREEGRPARRLELHAAAGRPVDASILTAFVARLRLAPDETVRLSGEALEERRSFADLKLALLLSILLVALAIAAAYESILLPFLVLAPLPVAGGGALLLLLVTGQSLNLMSLVGLILLSGIVANHTVVLVDRIEGLRRGDGGAAGLPESEALRQAVSERYRPVVMTTATTLLGMLPLALLPGEGVELRRALSLSVLGGLTTSTFATLLVVPLLHRAVEPFRRRA